MPHPFNNQAADELSRAWDDIVLHREPQSDDATLDTIHQLHALDDAPAPDRAYVAALRRSLLNATPATSRSSEPAEPIGPATTMSPTPFQRVPHQPMPIPVHERRSRLWELAAVAAVLIVLIAGAITLRPEPESQFAHIAASASPSPSQQPAETVTPEPTPLSTAITPVAPTTVTSDGIGQVPVLNDPASDDRIITLYEATLVAAAYLGVSINDLAAEYIAVPLGAPTYRVSHAHPDLLWPDEVVVNADTGRIISASQPSHSSDHAPLNEIDDQQAREIAEAFGQSSVAEFDQLSLAEENSQSSVPTDGGSDRLYSASWFYRAPESGAWLPAGIIVRVNLRTSLIQSFDIVQSTYDGATDPIVTRDEAISAALDAARAEFGIPDITAGNVELGVKWYVTETDEQGNVIDGEFRLVWFIPIDNLPAETSYASVEIDALTGEIVTLPGPPNG